MNNKIFEDLNRTISLQEKRIEGLKTVVKIQEDLLRNHPKEMKQSNIISFFFGVVVTFLILVVTF